MNTVAAQLQGVRNRLNAEIIGPGVMRRIKIGQDEDFQSFGCVRFYDS